MIPERKIINSEGDWYLIENQHGIRYFEHKETGHRSADRTLPDTAKGKIIKHFVDCIKEKFSIADQPQLISWEDFIKLQKPNP